METMTRYPTFATSGAGPNNWSNPINASEVDNAYAEATVQGNATNELNCLAYRFELPSAAVIHGIVVTIRRKSNSDLNGGSRDASVKLIKGGATQSADRAHTDDYPTQDVFRDHGTSTDLWADTWTPAQINAADFGVAFAAEKQGSGGDPHTITVDSVAVTVYYDVTLPGDELEVRDQAALAVLPEVWRAFMRNTPANAIPGRTQKMAASIARACYIMGDAVVEARKDLPDA